MLLDFCMESELRCRLYRSPAVILERGKALELARRAQDMIDRPSHLVVLRAFHVHGRAFVVSILFLFTCLTVLYIRLDMKSYVFIKLYVSNFVIINRLKILYMHCLQRVQLLKARVSLQT